MPLPRPRGNPGRYDFTEPLWRIPIALERTSLAVMDGHHRLEAARRLRLKYVSCLLLDYDSLEVDATRHGYLVNPHEIVRRARSGELYPSKNDASQVPIAISNLQYFSAAAPRPVSNSFLARVRPFCEPLYRYNG